jgi:hypothetical protein
MVMMRSTVERGCGSGVLISSGQEASVGLQNTACSGVAKRCVQSIDAGRNAYLRLSGCIFCFGPRMACLDPDLCYVINDVTALIPSSPASQSTKPYEQCIVMEKPRLSSIRDQQDPTQEPSSVPVPDRHKYAVIDHWMYRCLRALTSMHVMQPLSCVRSGLA